MRNILIHGDIDIDIVWSAAEVIASKQLVVLNNLPGYLTKLEGRGIVGTARELFWPDTESLGGIKRTCFEHSNLPGLPTSPPGPQKSPGSRRHPRHGHPGVEEHVLQAPYAVDEEGEAFS